MATKKRRHDCIDRPDRALDKTLIDLQQMLSSQPAVSVRKFFPPNGDDISDEKESIRGASKHHIQNVCHVLLLCHLILTNLAL